MNLRDYIQEQQFVAYATSGLLDVLTDPEVKLDAEYRNKLAVAARIMTESIGDALDSIRLPKGVAA